MEKFNAEQNETKIRQRKLEDARKEVEKIGDKLGMPIDEGIKETVAILMAMGLPTTSSCAGHKGEEGKFGLPYVQIFTEEPEGWRADPSNKELGELWRQSNLKQRKIVQPLLDEFNKSRQVPSDIKLYMSDMGFEAFRIENTGGIEPNSIDEAIKIVEAYQHEMDSFTKFLVDKYLNGK